MCMLLCGSLVIGPFILGLLTVQLKWRRFFFAPYFKTTFVSEYNMSNPFNSRPSQMSLCSLALLSSSKSR